ncbi:glycosyltransferase [Pararhodobacter sp.]|uniref:glycosyltransferase n=1 Tax=Pararhodobacter sp. TaxID=2127056 RepID=UPI002FDEB785
MPALLILSPAPVIEIPGREVVLDVKFVEGMKLHSQFWPGRIRCVLRRGAVAIPGGMRFSPRRLGFEIVLLDPDEPIPDVLMDEAALVFCAADDARYLHLPDRLRGRLTRLVYTLESTPAARMRGALFERQRSIWHRLESVAGALRNEASLRAALRAADGLQFKGYAVQQAYRWLRRDGLIYLDNRLRTPMLARAADQQARGARLLKGAPLSLVHIGPLEDLTGVMDLLQAAFLLKQRGVNFRLELFGEGALAGRLRSGIAAMGLGEQVTLAGNPGFEAELVPHLRGKADLLLAAGRQPDPASLYTEAMGCGVPVLGYANAMWRKLQAESGGGWLSRAGSVSALTAALARLDGDRQAIIRASASALDYARGQTFEHVFARRMTHLRSIAGLE